jgi:hypothetical protein
VSIGYRSPGPSWGHETPDEARRRAAREADERAQAARAANAASRPPDGHGPAGEPVWRWPSGPFQTDTWRRDGVLVLGYARAGDQLEPDNPVFSHPHLRLGWLPRGASGRKWRERDLAPATLSAGDKLRAELAERRRKAEYKDKDKRARILAECDDLERLWFGTPAPDQDAEYAAALAAGNPFAALRREQQ